MVEFHIPVTLSTSTLLGLGRIRVGMTCLGKVSRKPRLSLSSALGNTSVVAISELVGTSHFHIVSR